MEKLSVPRASIELYHPRNRLKALNDQVSNVKVDGTVPVLRYFRSCKEILRMADVYFSEDQLETAFVLYQKFLSLILEQLPTHPGFAHADKKVKVDSTKQCKRVMETAEKIKQKLAKAYNVEYEARVKEEQIRFEHQRIENERRLETEKRLQEEKKNLLEAEEKQRIKQAAEEEDRKFAIYVQKERDRVKDYPQPSAPPNLEQPEMPYNEYKGISADTRYSNVVLPIEPPSYTTSASFDNKQVPVIDRSTKPVHFTQTESEMAAAGNKHGLKTMYIPDTLSKNFAQLAQENTEKNIETCGLLFGKLERGCFTVTHVLIPKQKGAPDSCTMLNEDEVFHFHDKFDLIQLGWIHTHPTQTAFLSSVDLHTHVGYQLMMPEAIAVVIAPKYDSVGIFQLTPEFGLDYISKCNKPGFHPHPTDPPLFSNCSHVKLVSTFTEEIVDLR